MGKADEAIDNFNLRLTVFAGISRSALPAGVAWRKRQRRQGTGHQIKESRRRGRMAEEFARRDRSSSPRGDGQQRLRRSPHYELGICLISIGQFDEAIWNLQQAVRIKDDYADAWTSLGGAELASNHPFDAVRDFSQAAPDQSQPRARAVRDSPRRTRLGMH